MSGIVFIFLFVFLFILLDFLLILINFSSLLQFFIVIVLLNGLLVVGLIFSLIHLFFVRSYKGMWKRAENDKKEGKVLVCSYCKYSFFDERGVGLGKKCFVCRRGKFIDQDVMFANESELTTFKRSLNGGVY